MARVLRERRVIGPSNDMAAFAGVLASAHNIIAVASAGLSAGSGIPTFRGAGGTWRKYNAMSLATPEAFAKNPSIVWQFYHHRREKALNAQPNAGHMALAMLSLPAIRHCITPKDSEFTLITQNVDGLSQRALAIAMASHTSPGEDSHQPKMLEIHGRLFDLVCSSDTCECREFNLDSPISATLARTEHLLEKGVMDPDIPVSDLPHCPKCNELARPGVVWFGEIPQHLDEIDELVDNN